MHSQIVCDERIHVELTDKIIKCFFEVYNDLGYGFLEKVYENAMVVELTKNGLIAETQKRIEVFYKGSKVGEYYADIVVNDSVIIELKATEDVIKDHEYQLLNYLKATDMEVGLLFNFGKKPTIRRKVYPNCRKS